MRRDPTSVEQIARVRTNVRSLLMHGGPVARAHSIREFGFPCRLQTGAAGSERRIHRAGDDAGGTALQSIQVSAIRTVLARSRLRRAAASACSPASGSDVRVESAGATFRSSWATLPHRFGLTIDRAERCSVRDADQTSCVRKLDAPPVQRDRIHGLF